MIPTADPDRRRRGVALVVVLWGLVLLSIIAGSFAVGTRTDAGMAYTVAENAKARALAEAGVQRGILELLRGDEAGWTANGTSYPVTSAAGEIAVTLQDELGKIDLNTAPDELLRSLFVSLGMDDDGAAALTDAVADYRDEDDLVRINGAEARDYRAAGLAHEPKNAPFEAIDEFRLVLGVSEPLYRRVASLVTVHSRRPWVNLATAPPDVLKALPGLDDASLERVLEHRDGGAGTMGAERDADSGGATALPAVQPTRFGRLLPRGNVVTVRAEARTAGGGVFVREAIVRLAAQSDVPFRYLDWKQGRTRPPVTDAAADPER